MARLLVALDACVFIEAARVEDGLCNAILSAAESGSFEVPVAPQVVAEVEAHLTTDLQRERLNGWRVLWTVSDHPTRQQLDAESRQLLAIMKHPADVPIAIAIRHSALRPHLFVTSNQRHWNPLRLDRLLGTRIITPADSLTTVGLARHARAPQVRSE